MIGFGIGLAVVGVLSFLFRRTFSELAARTFRGSGWVGLEKTAPEWLRIQLTIGAMLALFGAALIVYGALSSKP